eukprot:TRINITY_DN48808_c0_g1_i1.p1 TRINITY_DN48808_c0_g1~~TRINITY_DN48808_c0_g1_i1.p1  ORF type:complete len:494 (+),score=54.87 TRINITY_DN48808_c0_g1_i1:69-1484(+)
MAYRRLAAFAIGTVVALSLQGCGSSGPYTQCKMSADPKTPFSDSELDQVRMHFLANLDIEGTGMVVASPDHDSGPGGDYYYDWMRDGALSMHAYMMTAIDSNPPGAIENRMTSWLSWLEKSIQQKTPNTNTITKMPMNILDEPKFEIPSGEVFKGSWCRPQNDGPGLRAITLIALAEKYRNLKQRAWNLVKHHLDYAATSWSNGTCDLWEEVRSNDFFWNRFTLRKAFLQGATLAASLDDRASAFWYSTIGGEITDALGKHVQADGFVCESTNRCQDTAVIEALNVGYMEDQVFAPLSNGALMTMVGLSRYFCGAYEINQKAARDGTPGVLFGRYVNDHYDGGNPWILLTASAATLLYRQAESLSSMKQVNASLNEDVTAALHNFLGRQVTSENLLGAGDAMLLLMKKYLSNGMHMNEQIDRRTGKPTSATDLTWNYANVLKAMLARQKAVSRTRKISHTSAEDGSMLAFV